MKALEQSELNMVLNLFVNECVNLFGDKLSDIILFGSYARGDFADDSDIDVMVVFDIGEHEIRKYFKQVCHIASEIDLQYNVNMVPVLQSKAVYDDLKNSFGFCRNVENEGVSKYVKTMLSTVNVTDTPIALPNIKPGINAKAGMLTETNFSVLKINTNGWKFDREEANERQ
ncbi:MAG: nucleotidyltransferase domain-containing protein [Oscillospiraceae bacterium]|nr:nucleotidyltransferase domain-containing protein [Oscillospiraceae bacterium]